MEPVLQRLGLTFTALPEVEWEVYPFKSPLLKLNEIFPDGIEIRRSTAVSRSYICPR